MWVKFTPFDFILGESHDLCIRGNFSHIFGIPDSVLRIHCATSVALQ